MIKTRIAVFQITCLILGAIFPAKVLADETVYPSNLNIRADYHVSSYMVSIRDTLIITRSITNNEDFGLAKLYLADNFPIEFTLLDYSVLIDDSVVPVYYSGPIAWNEFPSYNAYNWSIGLPAPDDSLDRILYPGETLILRYSFNCPEIGEYSLPFHTFCAYGDNSGVFSTAAPFSITITPVVAIEDDEYVVPGDVNISRAYPNPFNREVVISYGGSVHTGCAARLAIYDITGRLVYETHFADKGKIHWRPADNVASGIYFYFISRAGIGQTIFGKAALLK